MRAIRAMAAAALLGGGALGLTLGMAGLAHAKAKDSITVGMVLEPPILDPTAGPAAAIKEVTYGNIFQGLVRIDRRGNTRPDLASSWTVSPDGLTYTFTLNKGVTFSDGEKFDCGTVKFSLTRAVAKDSTNPEKIAYEPIGSVSCSAPLTAVLHMKRPDGGLLFALGFGEASMVAPKTAATNKIHPVGTGPFILKTWIKGDRVVMVRNPRYWGKAPALKQVTFRFISDPTAATTAMMAGDIDAFPLFPAPEALPQIEKSGKFDVVIGTTEGKTIMALNNARKPFNDVRVRRALAYAIDRNALITALGGYGKPIGSHYIPGDPGYVDLTGTYPYNPAMAKKLLAEAGVKPGTRFTITLPPPPYARRGGEVIAAMLQQVGLNARLVPVEWAQWLDKVYKKSDFDATIISHVEPRDLDIYARKHYYFNFHSAAYQALFAKYDRTVNPVQHLKLAGDLQRLLAKDEPNVFLFALPKVGVWKKGLRGLWPNDPIFANPMGGVSWTQ